MNPAKGIRHLAARFEIPAAMAGMKKTKTNTKPKRTPSASQAGSTDDTAPAAAVESNGKGTRLPDVAATNLPSPPTVRHRLPPRGKKASVSAAPAEPAHPRGIPRKKNQPAPPPHSQGVSQASPPSPVLRGSCVASKPAVGAAPEVPEIPGSAELPNPARDRLFKDLQLAKAAWESASPKSPADLKRLRISFVMAVFGACTQTAYGLVKQGAWSSQQFESEYDAFFLQLASSAGLGRGRWILDDLWDEIKCHDVWKAYRRLLLGPPEASAPSGSAPHVEATARSNIEGAPAAQQQPTVPSPPESVALPSGAAAAKPEAKSGGRPRGTEVNAHELREYRGEYSQPDFADKCGVALITLQRGEAGGRWDDRTFDKVARTIQTLTQKPITSETLKNLRK